MKDSMPANGSPQPPQRMDTQEIKSRLLSAACYFGLAPLLWFFGIVYRKDRLLNHHLLYSLALTFIAICVIVTQIVAEIILYKIFGAGLQTSSQASPTINWFLVWSVLLTVVLLIINSVWNIGWFVSLFGALLGRTWRLPLISNIASMKSAIMITIYSSLLSYMAFLMTIGIGVHSAQIARSQPEKADVYILYTVGGYIPVQGLYEAYTPPSWAVTMAFYPLVLAGMNKYGDEGVSVLPLTDANFNNAIQNGRFIFIASHGGMSPGKLTFSIMPYREYGPTDVPQEIVGEQLQFVYFAGCDAGDLENQWRQALHLEDAIMFDRISIVGEHLMWVWTKSPAIISALN